ncbi:hypothetical protein DFH07DRAFT_772514 [Mycena maculata]|uniref:Uncharacterized protein n=1 Tax=Mycena maculata TaxID=230809 RepID=A0AAD7J792_9AGAR|nr:hypothetical protein DFH07DRAFT_772514 [Mycena maculata]
MSSNDGSPRDGQGGNVTSELSELEDPDKAVNMQEYVIHWSFIASVLTSSTASLYQMITQALLCLNELAQMLASALNAREELVRDDAQLASPVLVAQPKKCKRKGRAAKATAKSVLVVTSDSDDEYGFSLLANACLILSQRQTLHAPASMLPAPIKTRSSTAARTTVACNHDSSSPIEIVETPAKKAHVNEGRSKKNSLSLALRRSTVASFTMATDKLNHGVDTVSSDPRLRNSQNAIEQISPIQPPWNAIMSDSFPRREVPWSISIVSAKIKDSPHNVSTRQMQATVPNPQARPDHHSEWPKLTPFKIEKKRVQGKGLDSDTSAHIPYASLSTLRCVSDDCLSDAIKHDKGKAREFDPASHKKPEYDVQLNEAAANLAQMLDLDEPDSHDDDENPAGQSSGSELKLIPGLEDMFDDTAIKAEEEQSAVFNLQLQDPLLYPIYAGLPTLPRRHVFASFLPDPNFVRPIGGGVHFPGWKERIRNIKSKTLSTAMTFSGVFINPCHVSPAVICIVPTKNGGTSLRLNIDKKISKFEHNKVAICVTPGMCVYSHIMEPAETRGSTPMRHKFIDLLLHDQDWMRWESWMCFTYGLDYLHCTITDLAIQMTTMKLTKNSASNQSSYTADCQDIGMHTPTKPGTSVSSLTQATSSKYQYPVKYALMLNDTIPVYNATGKVFDFHTQLPELDKTLQRWEGEVPAGSFLVCGYTVTTYKTKATNYDGDQVHIGCNLIWAVVSGTPFRKP